MFSVNCTLYTVHCAACTVHVAWCSVHCASCTIHGILVSVHHTLGLCAVQLSIWATYSAQRAVYNTQCAVRSVHAIVAAIIVHCSLPVACSLQHYVAPSPSTPPHPHLKRPVLIQNVKSEAQEPVQPLHDPVSFWVFSRLLKALLTLYYFFVI